METIITTFHPKHFIEESSPHPTNNEPICIICGTNFSFQSTNFYCHICDFYFHKECVAVLMESELTINRPETHEHTLTIIRKKNSFNCDACGEIDEEKMNMYACLQCNFFVHRDCLYLPKAIKLTRHPHRLFHTFQVSDWNTKCRICNHAFVCGCGGYICKDKTCNYQLHSYCATDTKVWDGIDVEKEPEEMSNSIDITLEEVDGNIARHFSHHHDLMRLCVENEENDGRVCQACILPIDFDGFLGCKECDFALHETCARLPRKMEHASHKHPLTLKVNMIKSKEGFFRCSKCKRESCGFMYQCSKKECKFKMDAKCASLALANPLYNEAHQHPLTLVGNGVKCHECDLFLEFNRATLPTLVKYKHDIHPLPLYYSISSLHDIVSKHGLSLWCEICEAEISSDCQDIYGCIHCNTTLHVDCLIGKYPYLKPGHTIKVNGSEIKIASNSLSRPICHQCHRICQDKLIFKNKRGVVAFCSINCTYGKLSLSRIDRIMQKIERVENVMKELEKKIREITEKIGEIPDEESGSDEENEEGDSDEQ